MIWCFDVDGTLIDWNVNGNDVISIADPIDETNCLVAAINHNNIRLLKEKKARGCTVIVWSQGGFAHAEQIVKALQLEAWVDLVMTKPAGIVDDIDPQDWLPKRVMIPIDAKYK